MPPAGDLHPNQEVIVKTGGNHALHNPSRRVAARIETVARVWITIRGESGRTWRMRRDTQSENTGYGVGGARFRTIEQDQWEAIQRAAFDYLAEQGIEIKPGSRWRGREVEVAGILRSHLGH
jgi:hypothetical protein